MLFVEVFAFDFPNDFGDPNLLFQVVSELNFADHLLAVGPLFLQQLKVVDLWLV